MFRWGWLVALGALALDQVTKALIVWNIDQYAGRPGDIITLLPFLDIWHVRNTGIAFSIGNFGEGGRFFLGALAFAVSIALFWIGRKTKVWQLILAYGLIAGGAIGNAFDRLNPLRKSVVDFIHFRIGDMPAPAFSWPSFNVADMAIVLGVALILFDMVFLADKREKAKKAEI